MDTLPVIINPAAGQRTPVLADLNSVFHKEGVRWSVDITQEQGDGIHLAQGLAERGARMVAVYGGDGTISEVATGLAGSDTALGILPGGTGNVLAQEFGIPRSLTDAAQLLISKHTVRTVDMGEIGGRKFLLRAGAGLEALAVERTPRELKDRLGIVAYGIGGLQALLKTRPTQYILELDGQILKTEGVVCTVANASHLGIPGLRFSRKIDIEDGKLDVYVLRPTDIHIIMQFMSENVASTLGLDNIQHWQVSQLKIDADPPQDVQVDGDHVGMTPVEIRCIPTCLRVVVPK